MTSTLDLAQTTEPRTALTLADVCDQCSYVESTGTNGQKYSAAVSRAYVRTWFKDGTYLDWCHHHYRENETALLAVAVHVEDTSHLLNVKVESGFA
jgi:hypothetical protein